MSRDARLTISLFDSRKVQLRNQRYEPDPDSTRYVLAGPNEGLPPPMRTMPVTSQAAVLRGTSTA